MIKYIDSVLLNFRVAFTREASYQWFVIVVIGLILSNDGMGVTSIVRELSLNPKQYENLLHFFRSSAWEISRLTRTWVNIVKVNAPILSVNEMNILIGDGVKQAKEGRKMPGVKKLHQESENSSKAEYIMGHMFGVVSVLIGDVRKQFSLPLSASIHDGVSVIRGYEAETTSVPSHVVQVITQGGEIAKQLGKSVLLLDRYFLSAPALKKALEFVGESGEQLLQIVTKAKISCTAYTDPPAYCGKGRPRLKGDPVKLKSLFSSEQANFMTEELYLYGKMQTVQYHCIDLLWGLKLYKKLRFVLVKSETSPPAILVSTSLLLSPTQIIELYSYRYKIEISFKTLKHIIFGFCYHFWSAYMPQLNRYQKEYNTEALEAIRNPIFQQKIVASLKAIEGFVLCSCIACGVLQMISLKFSDTVSYSKFRWLRTKTNVVVSEGTIAYYFRKNFFRFLKKDSHFDIIRIILSKQDNSIFDSSESA